MGNPRIVNGRRDPDEGLAVRGRALGESFRIDVSKAAVAAHTRFRVEDLLMEEASGLIREAEQAGQFDWPAHGFRFDEARGIWEKRISDDEVARHADR